MCGYVERDCSPDRVKFDLVEGVTEGGDVGVPVLIEIITTQFLNPHILYQSHNSFGPCSPLRSPIRTMLTFRDRSRPRMEKVR